MSYFGSIYAEDIPHRAKAVYIYLRDRMNSEGFCWPSVRRIAADLNISESTVRRATRDLARLGFIDKEPRYRENGSRSSNLYLKVR